MKMKGRTTVRVVILGLLLLSSACLVPSLPGATPQSWGPCDNVLYPFFIGAHWIYQVYKADGSEMTKMGMTVTRVADSQATIDAVDLSTGVVAQTIAACDNGAITNFPTFSQNMLIGNLLASDLNLAHVSGSFAPSADVFIANDWNVGWSVDVTVSGTVQAQIGGKPIAIELKDTPVHMAWQTAGAGEAAYEAVSVPAGSFENALRVDGTITLQVPLDLEGIPVLGELTLHTDQWYQPYTGLLKAQIVSGEFTALGWITLPVQVDGRVELIEYLTAH